MSTFDLDALMAKAGDDLDAQRRKRITDALDETLEAVETEIDRKGRQATGAVLKRLTASLKAKETKVTSASSKALSELVAAHKQTLRKFETNLAAKLADLNTNAETSNAELAQTILTARNTNASLERHSAELAELEKQVSKAEERIAVAADDGAERVFTHTQSLLGEYKSSITVDYESTKKQLGKLERQVKALNQELADPREARKYARFMIIAGFVGGLCFLGAGVLMMGWTQMKSAMMLSSSESKLDTMNAQIRATNKELEKALRTTEHHKTVAKDLGVEVRRTDGYVQVALNDVTLRNYGGDTLIILDKGRKLKRFKGEKTKREREALLWGDIRYVDPKGLEQYNGRMWATWAK